MSKNTSQKIEGVEKSKGKKNSSSQSIGRLRFFGFILCLTNKSVFFAVDIRLLSSPK